MLMYVNLKKKIQSFAFLRPSRYVILKILSKNLELQISFFVDYSGCNAGFYRNWIFSKFKRITDIKFQRRKN